MTKRALWSPWALAGTLILAGCGAMPSLNPISGVPLSGDPQQVLPPSAPVEAPSLDFDISAPVEANSTVADVKYLTIILQPQNASQVTRTVYFYNQKVRFDSLPAGPVTVTVKALDINKAVIGSATKYSTIQAGTSTWIPLSVGISGSTSKAYVTVVIGNGTTTTSPSPSPTPYPSTNPTPTPAPTSAPSSTPAPVTGTSGYGVKQGYTPAYDVLVSVGSLNQALFDGKPEGTRFALAAGVHRLTGAIAPKTNQQILGMPGAVVNGSKVLTGWTQDGTRWYVGGQTQRLPETSASVTITTPESPMANKAEDTFYDGKPLFQVDSLTKLGPGKFYFDYSASRIYIGDNPSGHQVETTVATQAFSGGGSGVLIKNIVVEKFGNRAQTGALQNGGSGWKVEDCEVRYNHGVGTFIGDGGTIRGCYIHDQGQLGVAGPGTGNLVENNEIAYNNIAGYDPNWEAGGTKWAYATNLVVRNNWCHDNHGPGLWTDINNRTVTYEGNTVERNERSGIFHEISYDAIIRNNILRGNGTKYLGWEATGAGINLTMSQNVEVYGNTLEGNASGIVMIHDNRTTWDTKNNYVHDNNIQMTSGNSGILLAGSSDTSVFSSKNNRYVNNHYKVSNTSGTYWQWNGAKTWTQWKSAGQDTAGTLSGL